MVKSGKIFLYGLCVLLLGTSAQSADLNVISQKISADACDDRQANDDTKTSENRAVDKAGLAAIKTAGFIQKQYPDLGTNALDLIAYRIIDEYMLGQTHKITLNDANRVCVHFNAAVELTSEELAHLVTEYKTNDATDAQVAQVASDVKAQMMFKPRSLDDKKLLFIRNMSFWNGEETNHYKDLLTGLFSHSQYFYVTDDEKLADFTVTPRLKRAEVDEIDRHNHKMQMQIELETVSHTQEDFGPITEQQNHFILFAADKDEQEIADNLLRKLLTKAANEMSSKIDNFEAKYIENAVAGR